MFVENLEMIIFQWRCCIGTWIVESGTVFPIKFCWFSFYFKARSLKIQLPAFPKLHDAWTCSNIKIEFLRTVFRCLWKGSQYPLKYEPAGDIYFASQYVHNFKIKYYKKTNLHQEY